MNAFEARRAFAQACARISPWPLSPALSATLATLYQTPPRHYHNLSHLIELMTLFEWVDTQRGWQQPGVVYAALLFHDAVYRADRSDNEAASAALAGDLLSREPGWQQAHQGELVTARARVVQLINATALHGHARDTDADTGYFLDADMAILGAPAPRFAEYQQQIAAEYQHVPEPLFRAGRRTFLQRVLALPTIFQTELFQQRFEAAARARPYGRVAQRCVAGIGAASARHRLGIHSAMTSAQRPVNAVYRQCAP